jgi:glycosyltransferase involved in cell wall biosynthesis
MPRFSVVIPAYNAARTIGETVRSVLAQEERDFELIVVDDGSADRTPELVAEIDDPRISLVRQPNQGTAGARNTGIDRARAPYVSFLDNDDLWFPDYLREMGAALDAHPEAGFAYCDAWGLDDATLRINRFSELEYRPPPPPGAGRDETLAALATANFVMSSATVRREVLQEVGGFDMTVRGTDDYDLWLRILLSGHSAARAGTEPLLLQRGRFDSQSKDERMMLEGVRLVLARAAKHEAMPDRARRIALRQVAELDRGFELDARGLHPAALGRRLRAKLIAIRNRVRRRHYWPAEPPARVAEAFPELRRGRE